MDYDSCKMKKTIFGLTFFLFASLAISEELPYAQEDSGHLIVNNRILARVNNKTISVLDLMKKMDVFLAKSYPHLVNSPQARYQFFSSGWRNVLNQMIDTELMLADAEKLELKISDADIREQLHERFGPNIMPTLDKLGITYDEAWQMIYAENAVQRMTWYRVNSKAINKIGPQDIKEAYKKYCLLNPAVETWKYQVLSIRASDEAKGTNAAAKARENLLKEKVDFQILAQKMKELFDSTVTFNVSEEYEVTGKNLSDSHKKILASLPIGSYSEPVTQISRFDQSVVHRIFYLKDHIVSALPTFEEKSEALYETLVQEAIDQETKVYLAKLRERFGFDEKHFQLEIPEDFVPFSFR